MSSSAAVPVRTSAAAVPTSAGATGVTSSLPDSSPLPAVGVVVVAVDVTAADRTVVIVVVRDIVVIVVVRGIVVVVIVRDIVVIVGVIAGAGRRPRRDASKTSSGRLVRPVLRATMSANS